MMNIALLTVGGTGTRMHQDIPKQFLHVRNKPILIYTMEAFERHPSIDAIIVVGLERWIDIIWAYAKQFNITKLKWVVPGGKCVIWSVSLIWTKSCTTAASSQTHLWKNYWKAATAPC